MNSAITESYQQRFLQLAIDRKALSFGQFTLKSGRISPYFFNAGRFDSGKSLLELVQCYADALQASGLAFDMLFGPAYKGIPLAAALGCELARRGRDLPIAFNRKEAKTHGEGGQLIGAPLVGRVLIVDDVITAGTAIGESVELITAAGASPCGVLIALDRQERGNDSQLSASAQVSRRSGMPVIAVATLDDLLQFADKTATLASHRQALLAYRSQYGYSE